MFLKEQLNWNVVIPAVNLDIKGLMLQKAILVRLLDDFSAKKATKALGYLLAVTTLDKIGEGKVREHSGDVLFPLSFTCCALKSSGKMTDYQYQIAESPCFLNIKTGSRIEKDVTVRCIVIGVKYMEAEKELQAVVGLEGDYLGLFNH
uniref:DNA-directed RNA polymerase subunit n=1 Tax=Tanacetum cinerariifolium TaxID=118510 RepID=A0A6L2KR76_TANCI|nr:DNA-directed RNA polymerase V subunit 7-like [Tanacetum cinerariifolium]